MINRQLDVLLVGSLAYCLLYPRWFCCRSTLCLQNCCTIMKQKKRSKGAATLRRQRTNSLQEHFGKCQKQRNGNHETKSVRSDSSFSFSETVLGQLLAKQGLIAESDFEVEHKGSKKHLYAPLVTSKERRRDATLIASGKKIPYTSFRRPTRATRTLPTYPTTTVKEDAFDQKFDGDDLYLLYTVSLSFSKRVIYPADQ